MIKVSRGKESNHQRNAAVVHVAEEFLKSTMSKTTMNSLGKVNFHPMQSSEAATGGIL